MSRVPILVASVVTVAALATVAPLEWQRRRPSPAATAPIVASVKPDLVPIADAVRTLKLVTWQFDATVSAESVSDKWYGDAVATVRAPVRYQYGVDLAGLRREDVFFDGGFDGEPARYVFLVPPPTRIAAEVDVAALEQTLKTSGVRWRSANQRELEAARKRLAERAVALELSAEDAKRLADASREQLVTHLSRVLASAGREARAQVRFAE